MDYAMALDRLRPAAECTHNKSYPDIVRTWQDARSIPTDDELIQAFTEWEAEQIIQNAIEMVKAGAETQVIDIPNFATWPVDTGLTWIDANMGDTTIDTITSLADAKVVMKAQTVAFNALWRFVAALRDDRWPHLRDDS